MLLVDVSIVYKHKIYYLHYILKFLHEKFKYAYGITIQPFWRGFWWYRTLVRLWESDSPLLIWVALIKVVEDSNVFV